jgi:hypothetical protein
MSSSLLPVIVLVLLVLVILIVFLFRKSSPVAAGVPGVDITGDPNNPLRKWDCSRDNRQIIFSDVPRGLTPYLVPFNEDALRAQDPEDFKVLISIAADVRFRDSESREVDKFESSIKLWMSYNAKDVEGLENKYTIDDLVPVKIVPGATTWKIFSGKVENEYKNEEGRFGGVTITVDSWGDPPMGWGSPRSSS